MTVGGVEFSVPICDGAITLRGKKWGNELAPKHKRILALSGWLDNCGTWYSSAPYFVAKGYYFVAYDTVGYGISDHHTFPGFYNEQDEPSYVMQVADYLGWKDPFILIGHSRGSNLTATTAAIFPERISAVCLMEGSFSGFGAFVLSYEGTNPDPNVDEPADGGLRVCVVKRDARLGRETRSFKTFSEAVDKNHHNKTFPKTRITSYNLVSRHTAFINNEFKYVHDPNTYSFADVVGFSPLSNIYMKSFIECEVLMVNRRTSMWTKDISYGDFMKGGKLRFKHVDESILEQVFLDWNARIHSLGDKLTFHSVRGTHHVHSDKPEVCTGHIFDFLEKLDLENAPRRMPHDDNRRICLDSFKHILHSPDLREENRYHFSDASSFGTEFSFKSFQSFVGGIFYGDVNRAKVRILCVHDDQDSAGVFQDFANQFDLSTTCVVAIDRLGRGNTSWLQKDHLYAPIFDVFSVYDAAQHFGWGAKKFHLLCHARSSFIGTCYARCFKEQLLSLTFISAFADSSLPMSTPKGFFASDAKFSHLEDTHILPPQMGLNLFYRSAKTRDLLKRTETCSSDPRIHVRPPLGFAIDYLKHQISRIQCPVLLINATNNSTLLLQGLIDSALCPADVKELFALTNEERQTLFNCANVTEHVIESSHYSFVDSASHVAAIVQGFVSKFKDEQTNIQSRI